MRTCAIFPSESAGCQPAAFGSLAECNFAQSANSGLTSKIWIRVKTLRDKLPRRAGWQPALPQIEIL
jgi:hypothetical protein